MEICDAHNVPVVMHEVLLSQELTSVHTSPKGVEMKVPDFTLLYLTMTMYLMRMGTPTTAEGTGEVVTGADIVHLAFLPYLYHDGGHQLQDL